MLHVHDTDESPSLSWSPGPYSGSHFTPRPRCVSPCLCRRKTCTLVSLQLNFTLAFVFVWVLVSSLDPIQSQECGCFGSDKGKPRRGMLICTKCSNVFVFVRVFVYVDQIKPTLKYTAFVILCRGRSFFCIYSTNCSL